MREIIKKLGAPNLILLAVILLTVIAASAVLINRSIKSSAPEKAKEIPALIENNKIIEEDRFEEPAPPVLSGKQSYKLLSGESPSFKEAWIDPLDAAAGENQLIAARVENPSKIKNVAVTIMTDGEERTLNLKLTEGSEYNGVWSGSRVMMGTYERIYRFRFSATDETGKTSSITITSR